MNLSQDFGHFNSALYYETRDLQSLETWIVKFSEYFTSYNKFNRNRWKYSNENSLLLYTLKGWYPLITPINNVDMISLSRGEGFINPQCMCEGYSSQSVCVCVSVCLSVTKPAVIITFPLQSQRCLIDTFECLNWVDFLIKALFQRKRREFLAIVSTAAAACALASYVSRTFVDHYLLIWSE